MKQYNAYDLCVHSQLDIPEFHDQEEDTPADVTIQFSEVAPELEGTPFKHAIWQALPGKFLIDIPDIARYFVKDGQEIHIHRHGSVSDRDVRNFMLGSAFAALLKQRLYLPIHASSVATDKGGIFFLGRSGAGKSTLMAAMQQNGCRMLSDDITALRGDNGDPLQILPAFARTRLWSDSAQKLEFTPTKSMRIRSEVEKFSMPMENFCKTPTPVWKGFILGVGSKETVGLEAIDQITAFRHLTRLTYRSNFMKGLGLKQVQFDLASRLARDTKMFIISRPLDKFLLNELIDKISLELEL